MTGSGERTDYQGGLHEDNYLQPQALNGHPALRYRPPGLGDKRGSRLIKRPCPFLLQALQSILCSSSNRSKYLCVYGVRWTAWDRGVRSVTVGLATDTHRHEYQPLNHRQCFYLEANVMLNVIKETLPLFRHTVYSLKRIHIHFKYSQSLQVDASPSVFYLQLTIVIYHTRQKD